MLHNQLIRNQSFDMILANEGAQLRAYQYYLIVSSLSPPYKAVLRTPSRHGSLVCLNVAMTTSLGNGFFNNFYNKLYIIEFTYATFPTLLGFEFKIQIFSCHLYPHFNIPVLIPSYLIVNKRLELYF